MERHYDWLCFCMPSPRLSRESRVESRDSSIEHRALSIALVSRLARHHDFFGPKKKPLEGPTHPTIQPSPKSTQQLRTILPIRITAPSHPPQPSSLAGVLRADNRVPTYCTVRFSSARHLRACACACWLLWSVCLPACLSACLPACPYPYLTLSVLLSARLQ